MNVEEYLAKAIAKTEPPKLRASLELYVILGHSSSWVCSALGVDEAELAAMWNGIEDDRLRQFLAQLVREKHAAHVARSAFLN